MRARGDLTVLHEPFMYHHYLGRSERMFPGFEPAPDHPRAYPDIRAMILSHGAERPTFFKDMAYYVAETLPGDAAFLAAMSHAFLVRDPAEAILSYAKRDPAFTCAELGIEAQYRLYEALVAEGRTPLIITSARLCAAPEETMRSYWDHVGLPFAAEAFRWDDSVPEGWEPVIGWHAEVLRKGAIEPAGTGSDARAELAALGAPYTDYDRHHRPFFEILSGLADKQAHQK